MKKNSNSTFHFPFSIFSKKGFTLIETVIYAALVSIVIGMVLLALYDMVEAHYRSVARVEIEEESNFLMSKVVWVMSGATFVNQPASGATSTVLSVNKSNFPQSPVVLGLANGKVFISYAGGASTTLNSPSVSVSQLLFTGLGSASEPGVTVNLSLNFIPRGQWTIYNASTSLTTSIYARNQ